MRLTLTKTEIAIVQKLVIDRKRDIHNAGGDSKQYEMLSKLNKKIARQAKKFYQIETKITFTDGENEDERVQTFVVNTFNVDRAMMLITHYLKNKEEECEKQAKEKGHEFRKREIHTAIESAKPIPVGRFIPKEFSMAYME